MGASPTYAAIQSNIPCTIAPASFTTTKELEREDVVVQNEIHTSTNVRARMGDRWNIGGVFYLVLAYKAFTSPFTGTIVYTSVTGKRNQP